MDETAMRQALDVLRAQFGDRLPGDMLKGEVTLRQALMQQMNIDESAADKLVKQLTHTGWLTFRSSGADDDKRNVLNPVVGLGGRAPEGAHTPDAWTGAAAVDTPDAARVPVEPFIAGAALAGMQTGSTPAAASAGVALAGVTAAGLTGRENVGTSGTSADGTVTGADTPDANQDAINSYAADANPSDPRGYWVIGMLPGTTPGAMSPAPTTTLPPTTTA